MYLGQLEAALDELPKYTASGEGAELTRGVGNRERYRPIPGKYVIDQGLSELTEDGEFAKRGTS